MKKLTLLTLLVLSQFISSQTIDNNFNIGSGFNEQIWSMSIQSDSKIIAAGYFVAFNGQTVGKVTRINPDGTIDNSFNNGLPGIIGNAQHIYTSLIQNDGKIILSGFFSNYNGVTVKNLVRINNNGIKDSDFLPPMNFGGGVGGFGIIRDTKVQTNNKILICGDFTSPKNYIARLNQDGTLDSAFTSGQSVGAIENIIIQDDGKILLLGYSSIKRINQDGTADNTFQTVTLSSSTETTPYILTSSALQNDGKILIGGRFTNVNSTNMNRLARLNSDGTIDSSFNVGIGASEQINSIAIQPDNKILIGGSFLTYNGISSTGLARINSNGDFDNSFTVGKGANGISSIIIQSDGKILIAGAFTEYNNNSINRIARINQTTLNNSSFDLNKTFKLYPNPTTGKIYSKTLNSNIEKIEIYNGSGQLVSNKLDISSQNSGIYFVKITSTTGEKYIEKIIKTN